jgi:EAL domain-containing protein (putative c-di-GMP-specific phosphodiesterase class I)
VAKLDAPDAGLDDGPAFVRSIVALARSRRMGVIAEGVETAEQLAQLRDLDCEIGQGHFFSEAVDDVEASALIAGPVPWEMALEPRSPGPDPPSQHSRTFRRGRA